MLKDVNDKLIRRKVESGEISEANAIGLINMNCPARMAVSVVSFASVNGISVDRAYKAITKPQRKLTPTASTGPNINPQHNRTAEIAASWEAAIAKVHAEFGGGTAKQG